MAVTPSSVTLPGGATVSFVPTPVCQGGVCPHGISYNWSETQPLGTFQYTDSDELWATVNSSGQVPAGIALDPATGDLYVTNDNVYARTVDSNLSVISAATDTVVGTIPVGASPAGIAYDPLNGYLYVADCGSGNVSVVDPVTMTEVASISVALSGCTIGSKMYMNFAPVAFDPANGMVYVSTYGNGQVDVINTTLEEVVSAIEVGGAPYDFAYDPTTGDMYVTETVRPYVAVVNATTNSVVGQIPVGVFPSGVVYDAGNGELYVADSGIYVRNPQGFGNISVIDPANASVVQTIFIRGYPWFLAYDPASGELFETDSNTTELKVLSDSTNTVVGSIPLGTESIEGSRDFMDVYDPSVGEVFSTGINYNTISVVNGANPSDAFTAGGTPGNTTLFVNASWNGTVVQSAPIPVEITASPVPVISDFGAFPDPLRVNSTTWVNVSAFGGHGSLSYGYAGLPAGCSGADTDALACTPSLTGRFQVRVFVNDSAGDSATATTLLDVVPPPTAPTVDSFAATPSTLALGDWTNLSLSVSGGAAPLAFAYAGLPPGCASSDVAVLPCDPSAAGTFVLRAYANDSLGRSANATAVLAVAPARYLGPTIRSFEADPDFLGLGAETTFTLESTGGVGTVTLAYAGLPPGCTSLDDVSFRCLPTAAGTFLIRAFANDSLGESANATTSLTVYAPPSGPSLASFAAHPAFLTLGEQSTLEVLASGGVPPLTYAYTGLPPGCASLDSPTLPCQPTVGGTFAVRAYVNDSAGNSASSLADLVINATAQGEPPAARGSGASSTSSWLKWPELGELLAGAALLALAALVGVKLRGRKSQASSSSADGTPARSDPSREGTGRPSGEEGGTACPSAGEPDAPSGGRDPWP